MHVLFIWYVWHDTYAGGLRRCSPGKQPKFRDANPGFPAKERLRNERRNSILTMCYYPVLGIVLLISCAAREICFNQSEALPRSEQWHVINMEFLRSFLRRHFAVGELVVASQNAGCFLRLQMMHLSKVGKVFVDWSYKIRSYNSPLLWRLHHLNASFIRTLYFKQISSYCNALNAKTNYLWY